ncbi:MAG: HNH endonuclease signature motif containing protein [Acidimicrobiia bacterium]
MLDGAGAESNPRRREVLFTVLIDHETFLSGTLHPDSVLETIDGSVIPIGIAERWLCDSRWQLLVQDAAGEVLMLGRKERYANRAIRRALAARDRGCAAPGCTAPVSQCDAHHVTWWEHDGLSNVDQMALLCRHHHRMVHAGTLEIMMVNGLPMFLDRDGNELTDGGRRRPPPEASAA